MHDTSSNRSEPTPPFRVGVWHVFPRCLLIKCGDHEEKVTPKVMEALVYLAGRSGEVVTKDELMDAAWPGVYVSDGAIRRTISHLRDVLDDDAQAPRYIETISKVGYRFIAPVQPLSVDSTAPSAPSRDGVTVASKRSIGLVRRPYLAALVFVLLAGGAASMWLLAPLSDTVSGTVRQVVPLTTYLGDEVSPSLSPTGTHLAFTRVQTGPDGTRQADLFVKLLDGEEALQLTNDAATEYSTIWSPDGTHLAFVRIGGAQGEECGVYRIAAIGGPLRKVASCVLSRSGGPPALSWSPDGDQIAMARPVEGEAGAFSIYGLSVNTGIARGLSIPPAGASDHHPAFASDGEAIAFVRHHDAGEASILLKRLDVTGPPRIMHRLQGAAWGLHWSDDGRYLYFQTDGPTQAAVLWRIARNGGVREQLALPPEAQGAGDVAIQQGHLVFATAQPNADLWRVDRTDGSPVRWPFSSTRLDLLPALNPTGQYVAFFSNRSGRVSLWMSAVDGSEQVELAPARGTDFTQPAWFAGGEQLAYGSSEGLFVLEVATGRVQRATSMKPRNVVVAPDGVIYFTHETPEGPRIWRTMDGEVAAERVSEPAAFEVLRHVDADSMTYTLPDQPTVLWRRSRTGGGASIVAKAEALREARAVGGWTFAEGGFYYVAPGPDAAIQFFDIAAQRTTRVQGLAGGQARAVTLAPDGRSITYDWEHPGGFDVVMIKGYEDANI